MKKLVYIFAGLSIVGVVFLFILGGTILGNYNSLQVMDETINSNWAQVENQLQRRADLIPNLVNTVKGYAKHEKDVFTSVAESRSKLSGAIKKGNMKNINAANSEFIGSLPRLLAIAENYPQLKADKSFIRLQDELAGTENRIVVARRDYNESVKILNGKIRVFPTNIIAGVFNIDKREYFKVEERVKKAPVVKFE